MRRAAQNAADEALKILLSVMRNEKAPDATRASAAEKVLRVAGVPMTEEKAPEGDPPDKPLTSGATPEDLEAAATQGEG